MIEAMVERIQKQPVGLDLERALIILESGDAVYADARTIYRKTPGEVQARNAGTRATFLTPEERRTIPLSETRGEPGDPALAVFDSNIDEQNQLGEGTQPAPERVSEIIPRLQENFTRLFATQVEVITDPTEIDNVLADSKLVSPNGQILGFVKGNKVYIDPRYARVDTPIHEFAHIWNSAIKRLNPEFYARGLELIQTEGQEYIRMVMKQYPTLTGEALYEEALTWAISDKGAKLVNRSQTPLFLKWLQDMWKMIGNTLGLTMSPEALASLSLNRYTELVAGTMLRPESGLEGGQIGDQTGDQIQLQLTPQSEIQRIRTEYENMIAAGMSVPDAWDAMINLNYLPGTLKRVFPFPENGLIFSDYLKEKTRVEFEQDQNSFGLNYRTHLDEILAEFTRIQQQSPGVPLSTYVEKLVTGNTPSGNKYGMHAVFTALQLQLGMEELREAYGDDYTKWGSEMIHDSGLPEHFRQGITDDARAYKVTYTLEEAARNAIDFGAAEIETILEYFHDEMVDKGLQEYFGAAVTKLLDIPNKSMMTQEDMRSMMNVKALASVAGRLLAFTKALKENQFPGVASDIVIKSIEKEMARKTPGTTLTTGQRANIKSLVDKIQNARREHEDLTRQLEQNPDLVSSKPFVTSLVRAKNKYMNAVLALQIYRASFTTGNWTAFEKWKNMIPGALMSLFRSVTIGIFGNLENAAYRGIWSGLGLRDVTNAALKAAGVRMVNTRKHNFLAQWSRSFREKYENEKAQAVFARTMAYNRAFNELRQILINGQSTGNTDITMMKEANRANQPMKEFIKSFNMMFNMGMTEEDWATTFDRLAFGEDGQVTGLVDPKLKDIVSTFFWNFPVWSVLPEATMRAVGALSLDRQIENMVIMNAVLDLAHTKGLSHKDVLAMLNAKSIVTDRDSAPGKLGADAVFMGGNPIADGIINWKMRLAEKQRDENFKAADLRHKGDRVASAGHYALYTVYGILDLLVNSVTPFTKLPTNYIYKALCYGNPVVAGGNAIHWAYSIYKQNKAVAALKEEARSANQVNAKLQKSIDKAEEELFYRNEMFGRAMLMLGMSFAMRFVVSQIVREIDDDDDEVVGKEGAKVRIRKGIFMGAPSARGLTKEKAMERYAGIAGRMEFRQSGLSFGYANMGIFGLMLATEKMYQEMQQGKVRGGTYNMLKLSAAENYANQMSMLAVLGTASENLSFMQVFSTISESLGAMKAGEPDKLDPFFVQVVQNILSPLYNNTVAVIPRAAGEKAPPLNELSEVFANNNGGHMSRIFEKALFKLSPKTPFESMRSQYYKEWVTSMGVPERYYNRSIFTEDWLQIAQATIDPFAFGFRNYETGKAEEARRYAELINDAIRFADEKLGRKPNWDFVTGTVQEKHIALNDNMNDFKFLSHPEEGTLPVPFDILLKYRRKIGEEIMNRLDINSFEIAMNDIVFDYQKRNESGESLDEISAKYELMVSSNADLFNMVFDENKIALRGEVLDYYADKIASGELDSKTTKKILDSGDKDLIDRLIARKVDVEKLKKNQ